MKLSQFAKKAGVTIGRRFAGGNTGNSGAKCFYVELAEYRAPEKN
jgi:hypothetical protein